MYQTLVPLSQYSGTASFPGEQRENISSSEVFGRGWVRKLEDSVKVGLQVHRPGLEYFTELVD